MKGKCEINQLSTKGKDKDAYKDGQTKRKEKDKQKERSILRWIHQKKEICVKADRFMHRKNIRQEVDG